MLKPSRPRFKTGSQHTQKVSKVVNLGLDTKRLDLSLGRELLWSVSVNSALFFVLYFNYKHLNTKRLLIYSYPLQTPRQSAGATFTTS